MKKWLRVLAIVTAAMASSSCAASADGPPQIVVDRTACAHCGMLVSEPAFAAAYRAPEAKARVFDDIGCLLEAIRTESDPHRLRFWFHDVRDGRWIDGDEAIFVRAAELRTPMGGGLTAYDDAVGAERAATRHRGRVVGRLRDLVRNSGGVQ